MDLDVVVGGHVCVDLTPTFRCLPHARPGELIEAGPLRVSLGGCVGNTGGWLVQHGLRPHLVACVGDDALGAVASSLLDSTMRGSGAFHVVPGTSTSYSVVVDAGTTDRAIWHHVGANQAFDATQLRPAAIVHVGYPPLLPSVVADVGRSLSIRLAELRDEGAVTSVDLAAPKDDGHPGTWEPMLRRVLASADIATPSVDDLSALLGWRPPHTPRELVESARALLGWGPAVVMLTAGRDGLALVTAGADRLRAAGHRLAALAESWMDVVVTAPARARTVTATTGAGDAAAAGLVQAVLNGESPPAAAECAATAAATVVEARGATTETT